MANFIPQNKGEMRRQIGRNIEAVVIGTAKSTVDTSSLIDPYGLRGGDDEHNGKEVMIYDAAGSIVDGEKQRVTDYAGSTSDATTGAFTASITSGDKYEMWEDWVDIDGMDAWINNAIRDIAREAWVDKVTEDTFTWLDIYEYACLTDFVAVHTVEYESDNKGVDIDLCETAWDESVDSDVTVAASSGIFGAGSKEIKLTVAAGASANDLLATQDISSMDLSDYDKVEISVYSTVALAAGDIQLLLDNTASCASAVESLDIPATTVNTKTRHIITLANPLSDTAIISIGLKMVTDKGAFSLYVQKIKGVLSNSREYKELNPRQWELVHGSSPRLKITSSGLSVTGTSTLLRVSGYKLPAELTDDTTDCEVDPAYLIPKVSADVLLTHYRGNLDTDARNRKADRFLAEAMAAKGSITSGVMADTRVI